MKLFLMNPPWLFKLPTTDRLSNILGLLYLGTTARLHGHEVTVLDSLREDPMHFEKATYCGATFYRAGLSYRDILSRIPQDIDCVCIGAPFTNLFHIVREFTEILKKERPNILVALGGGLPSAAPDLCSTLQHVDVVVMGECELTFMEYLADSPKPSTSGSPLLLRGASVIELDSLPIPDRSLANVDHYFQIGPRNRTPLPTTSMITSRGCPYYCHFCSIRPTMGPSWRGRSPELVLEELKILVNDYGVQIIEFEDDNFLHDEARAFRIFEDMAKFRRDHHRLIGFSLPNGVRIDKLSPELLKMMKAAGLHKIVLPVEHGDISIRRKMGKPLSDEMIVTACEWASVLGTVVEVFVMIGYPDETREVFDSGLKLIGEMGSLPNIEINYLFPQPYPGTKLRRECLQKGYEIHVPDETLFCGIGPVITTPLFDRLELDRRRETLDVIRRRLKARAAQKFTPRHPQAARSKHSEDMSADGTRMVMIDETLTPRIAGRHNGSYFLRCGIDSDVLRDVTMMLSEFEHCDFSGADLRGFNAAWSTFDDCSFCNTLLQGADLSHCILRGVDFSGLDLTGVDLTGADLTGADLSGANLTEASLFEAKLAGVNLFGALLHKTNLSCSTIVNSTLDYAELKETVAREALFEDVSLKNAVGVDASLQRSHFVNCDFSGARISGYFTGAQYQNNNLEGATLDQQVELDDGFQEVWDGSGRHVVSAPHAFF
jgi:anaerobic magnesium-protoporphyrin IX monomethyl ester cyclase